MNIKIIYADRIDSWDTRADGSASTSHAVLRVNGQHLELWSDLKFEDEYDEKTGEAQKTRTESGRAESIMRISAQSAPKNLSDWLAAAHEESGLRRLDVDGETIYEYKKPAEEESEKPGGKSEEIPNVWMPDE